MREATEVALKSLSDSDEQRMVWAEVYAPNRPDADGEFMDVETIRKMAHSFLRNQKTRKVDVQHDNETYEGVAVVESFVSRKGDPDFIEDSWVVGMHIDNDVLWEQVKKGEINGFSVEAMVAKDDVEVDVEIPPVVLGKTTKSENHEHDFMVAFDDDGKFLGGQTTVVDGHMHVIKAGTVTEPSNGHTHRFSSVDNITITEAD